MPIKIKKEKIKCGLYIVSTPIGNLRDITLRALDVLGSADVIYCEDKRVTSKLLNAYSINTPLRLYHDHNGEKQRPEILNALSDGQTIALVSDAGTPGISDPGYKLIREVAAAGHDVFPVPGASAVLSALVGGGLATDQFVFAGFMPPKSAARREKLKAFVKSEATLVFYETANRMAAFMKDVSKVLGNREIVMARELTKKFEEFIRGNADDICAILSEKKYKGEFVVLIGAPDLKELAEQTYTDDVLDKMLGEALGQMGMSVRDASAYVAEETGLPKRRLYARALGLTHQGSSS